MFSQCTGVFSDCFLGKIALVQAMSPIYLFLCSMVCLSFVCRLSHLCNLLKPFDRFRCHLAGKLAGYNDILC